MSDSQRPRGLQPTRPLCTWDFPGKSTGVEKKPNTFTLEVIACVSLHTSHIISYLSLLTHILPQGRLIFSLVSSFANHYIVSTISLFLFIYFHPAFQHKQKYVSYVNILLKYHRVILLLIQKFYPSNRASLVAQTAKNLPVMQEIRVRSLGWEDPPEKGLATHSSILAWRIPWTEEAGELQSRQSQRIGHD